MPRPRWRRGMSGTGPVRALLLGEGVGLLAGAAAQTTVAWWLAARGGGADLARYGAAMAAISLLALPLLSPLGDRWPRRRLIRLAQAGLLLDAVLLALLAWQDLYRLPLLCACGALSVLAQAVLMPAQASLLPDLVPADRLPEAIRWRRGAQAIGGLLGPALGGAALAAGGVPLAALLNVALFSLSALTAWRLGTSTAPASHAATTGWFDDLAAGLRAKWRVRLDRWWTLAGALMMVFLLPCTGLLLPLRLQSLQLSASWFGACGAALSLGVLAGVAGGADALIRRVGRLRAIGIAVVACGLSIGAVGLCDHAMALVLLFGVVGLCLSVTQLVGQTHRALAVPHAFRARMAAGHLTIAQLAAMLAPALAGALLLRWPVSVVYLSLAAAFLGSGLLLLAVPDLGRFLRLGPEDVKDWYGKTYPEAFTATPR